MDIVSLLNNVSKISKQDRQNLVKSENLDQNRCLKVNFKNQKNIEYEQISFAIKLCTQVEMLIEHFECDIYFHDFLRKAAKHKK